MSSSNPVIVSALVQNVITKGAIDYVNKFPADDFSKLVKDFNQKLLHNIEENFLKSVYDYVLQNPILSENIGVSEQENHKNRKELYLKSKEISPFDKIIAQRYIHLFNRAKEKGLPFDLELKDVRRLMKIKRCHYTGETLTDLEPSMTSYRTFDRVDNTKGYTKDNVVVCTFFMNQFKSDVLENKNSKVQLDFKMLKDLVLTLMKKGF